MPYNEGRVVHDADAHIMETPTWLRDHAEAAFRDRLPVLRYQSGNELRQTGDPEEQQQDLLTSFERLRKPATDPRPIGPPKRPRSCSERTSPPRAWFIPEDRPRAFDLLGFSSQLVFNTFHNSRLHDFEHGGDESWPMPRRGPTTGGCSSSARSIPGCWPRATSRWSTPERAVARPGTRWRPGRGGPPGGLGVPAAVLAQPP